ncbi:hypothetical protein [Lacticaseibacillus parakribbianus]|uniref:hypothetical protein n=1 Tax=Lacticaseibacillus parakribbianus TaxID=2970927 RepID=UPI0021CB0B7E|nr:hypothetical protein [Lacticaseibacillus parakribbianus]
MREILKLYGRRYRWLIVALFALLAVTAGTMVSNEVESYHEAKANMVSKKTYAKDQAKDLAKNKGKVYKEVSYAQFVQDTLNVYQDELPKGDHTPMMPPSVGNLGVNTLYLLAAFGFGLALAGWDHFGKFDRFVLGTRFDRRKLYWGKVGLGAAAVLGSVIVGQAIMMGSLYANIPAQYINVTGLAIFGLLLYDAVAALMAYVIATVLAMFAGRLWQVGVVSVILLWSQTATFCNLQGLYAQLVDHVNYNSFGGALATPGRLYWPTLIAMALLAVGLALVGAWGFNHLSLEHDAAVLVRPLQVLFSTLAVLYGFGFGISWSRYGYFEFANSLGTPLVVLALCLLWWFWPKLAQWRRARVQKLA